MGEMGAKRSVRSLATGQGPFMARAPVGAFRVGPARPGTALAEGEAGPKLKSPTLSGAPSGARIRRPYIGIAAGRCLHSALSACIVQSSSIPLVKRMAGQGRITPIRPGGSSEIISGQSAPYPATR